MTDQDRTTTDEYNDLCGAYSDLRELAIELEEALFTLELAIQSNREVFGSPAHKNARVVLSKASKALEDK